MSCKFRPKTEITRIRDLVSAARFKMADDAALNELLGFHLSFVTELCGFRLIDMTSDAGRQR